MSEPTESHPISRRRMVSGMAALGFVLPVLPAATVAREGEEEIAVSASSEIHAAELGRIDAMLAHDAERVDAITASEFEFITPLGTVQTRDMFVGGIASGMIDNRVLEPVGPLRIRTYCDAAAVRYQARSELAFGEVEYALDLWFTALYEVRERGWKIVWLQATELPAATASDALRGEYSPIA